MKATNSKKKGTTTKGKLQMKNKELSFTFELTDYLLFPALLKEHDYGKMGSE